MTDCPRGEIRDLLPDLLHHRLGAESRAEVERHLAKCPECSAELELMRSAWRALSGGAPRVDAARIAAAVATSSRARESGTLPRSMRGPMRRRRFAVWEWRAAAGIAIVAIGVASYAVGRGQAPSAISSAPRSGAAPVSHRPAGGLEAPRVATRGAESQQGLMFAGGVSDLPDSALSALIQSIDDLQAVPDVEPPVLLVPVGEGVL